MGFENYLPSRIEFANRDISDYVNDIIKRELVDAYESDLETDNTVLTRIDGINITRKVDDILFSILLSILREKELRGSIHYSLMWKNFKLFDFLPDLRVFEDSLKGWNENMLPVGMGQYNDFITDASLKFIDWLNNRALALSRENAKRILNGLNESQSDIKHAVVAMYALSLTDHYWIKKEEHQTWENMNLFDNNISKEIQHLAITGKSNISIRDRLLTPETQTQGAYKKAWDREEGGIYLHKGNGSYNIENIVEFISSEIIEVLRIPHVRYELSELYGVPTVKCIDIIENDTDIVDGFEWLRYNKLNTSNMTQVLLRDHGVPTYQMILVDGIINNVDRHIGNWGFYHNPETGEFRMHPLLDHNGAMVLDYKAESNFFKGKTLLEAAKYAYTKLGRPVEVKDLLEWLHKNKKYLIRQLNKDIFDMLVYNCEYILK